MMYVDKVSLKYEKYIIKLVISESRFVYMLWSANLQDKDVQYLLCDGSNQILSFFRISDLIDYFRNNVVGIDSVATRRWAKKCINHNKAYATYDLTIVNEILNNGIDLENITRTHGNEMLDFSDLFSDFVYQVENSGFLYLVVPQKVNFSDLSIKIL